MKYSTWLQHVIDTRERIGKGAGRVVYDINGRMILKVPKVFMRKVKPGKSYREYSYESQKMIAQSIVEFHVYQNCPEDLKYLLCPIVDYFFISDIPIIFMRKMRVARDNKKRLRGKGKAKIRRLYGKDRKAECIKFFEDTERLVDMFRLQSVSRELYTPKHWGITGDKRIKYIDYGYVGKDISGVSPEMVKRRSEP